MRETRTREEGHAARHLSLLTAGLAVLSPLMIGGAPAWALSVASVMSVYLLGALLWGGVYLRSMWAPFSVGYLLSATGALLSLLPLSLQTLKITAPELASIWEGLGELLSPELGPLGQVTMSVTPVETVAWLCLQGACLIVAYVAYHLHRERTPVLTALGALGPLLTCYGVLHACLELDAIYGVYQSLDREALRGFVTPVINMNSAASVCLLSALCSLGVGVHKRAMWRAQGRRGEARWLIFFMMSALGVLLSGSRAAQLSLSIGAAVILLRYRASQRQPSARRGPLLLMMAGVALSAVVVAAIEWGSLSALLNDTGSAPRSHLAEDYSYPRLVVWSDCWRYLQRHWLWGTGRGSFGEVYMSLQSFSGRLWISHPESHPLQQLLEGGSLGALGGVLVPLWAWLNWWRRSMSQAHLSAFGLWVALGAVGAHQLFDFGFEYLGLSVPVAIGWGLLWSYLPADEERQERALRARSRRWRLLTSIALMTGVSLLCAVHYRHAQRGLRLREAVHQARVTPDKQRDLEALTYHPASAHLSLELLTQRTNRWMNRRMSKREPPLSEERRLKLSRWLRHVKRRGPRLSTPLQIEARLFADERLPALASLSYSQALNRAPWRFRELTSELTREQLMSPQLLMERLRAPYLRFVLERFGPTEVARLLTRSAWRSELDLNRGSAAAMRATLLRACAQVRLDGEGASLCTPLIRDVTRDITQALRELGGSDLNPRAREEELSTLRLDELTAQHVSWRLGARRALTVDEQTEGLKRLLRQDQETFHRRAARWGLGARGE